MKATANKTPGHLDDKKQVNIRWNSRIFFQIGIIISVLIVFFLMETNFEAKSETDVADAHRYLEEPAMMDYVIEKDLPKLVVPQKQPASIPVVKPISKKVDIAKEMVVIDTSSEEVETDILSSDIPTPAIVPASDPVEIAPEPSAPISVINVEHVPVFPGCELLNSNAEKIDCMSSKINAFINKNFRKQLLENLDGDQTYKIYVQFMINSQGYITNVRANSNNEKLKKEAQRVVESLPEMKPGKQGDKNVDVIYTVPIVFNIK